jgi:indole-3-glycerol phosphate synthase
MTFLRKIVEEKRLMIEERKAQTPLNELMKMFESRDVLSNSSFSPSSCNGGAGEFSGEKRGPFYERFSQRFPDEVKIIAEIKKASPSKGVFFTGQDIAPLIRDYEKGGASAISIITEEKYFQGSLGSINEAKSITGLPILRKDFIVDEYEIYRSKAVGADAVLLIGEVLDRHQMRDYLEIAEGLCIDVLIEVHSITTYEEIADHRGYILGINNRNLENLAVDLSVSEGILPFVPENCPVIVESGIQTREDIERFMAKGVSGFLVGTSLMMSKDPVSMLKNLCEKS